MKRVFTNSHDVIHLFASQHQEVAKCANVFFEGNKLYSYGYHYMLAEIIGLNAVIINDTGYSSTTSKHIGQAKNALGHYRRFFVTNICFHEVKGTIDSNLRKLVNARKPEMYISAIRDVCERFLAFQDFVHDNKIKHQFRLDKRSAEYKFIKKTLASVDVSAEISAVKEFEKKKAEKERAIRNKAAKTQLEEFYAHERGSTSLRLNDMDYLRISKDGKLVETTQCVQIKAENALTLYKLIKKGVDIKGRHIEHYSVTSINGTLKIGCHSINMDSVNSVGEKLLRIYSV
jgi:nitrogen regulatory protein PII-like uncharacterized protein